MIKFIVGFLVLFGLSALLIGAYLAPDDLRGCADTPSQVEGCGPVDAIIAVSGGDTEARAREAIQLFHAGWADLLIFSGAAADPDSPSNAEVMRNLAIESGINPNSVLVEESSTTTSENASETANILTSRKVNSAIVVTSGYHMRRASLEFQHKNPSIEFLSHPVYNDNQWGSWWWLTPRGWWLSLSELVKTVVVSLGGAVK